MTAQILIKNKPIKHPSFAFGKNKTGFLIIIKDYTLDEKVDIEKAVQDQNLNIQFLSDDLVLKTHSSYYVFNLTNYQSYFTAKSFFLGFSFEDKTGSLISEKINMFQVQLILQ